MFRYFLNFNSWLNEVTVVTVKLISNKNNKLHLHEAYSSWKFAFLKFNGSLIKIKCWSYFLLCRNNKIFFWIGATKNSWKQNLCALQWYQGHCSHPRQYATAKSQGNKRKKNTANSKNKTIKKEPNRPIKYLLSVDLHPTHSPSLLSTNLHLRSAA